MKYSSEYYKKNKDTILDRNNAWHKKNKESIALRKKKKYQKNKDEASFKSKKNYQEHRDKIIFKSKEYYQNNKEKIAEYSKVYHQNNKDKINNRRRIWYQENKSKLNEKQRKDYLVKIKGDRFQTIKRLRRRLIHALNSYSNGGKVKSSDEYGIDYQSIFEYIGTKPDEEHIWHIDHIKPLFLFDFNDGEQIIDAFSPENHQWLTAEENLKKSTHTQVNYTGGK